jgi:hypothetical protein
MSQITKQQIKISKGLSKEDYPMVKFKFEEFKELYGFYPAAGKGDANGSECACMGCANRKFTWAEWECWRKYNPEFNRIYH